LGCAYSLRPSGLEPGRRRWARDHPARRTRLSRVRGTGAEAGCVPADCGPDPRGTLPRGCFFAPEGSDGECKSRAFLLVWQEILLPEETHSTGKPTLWVTPLQVSILKHYENAAAPPRKASDPPTSRAEAGRGVTTS